MRQAWELTLYGVGTVIFFLIALVFFVVALSTMAKYLSLGNSATGANAPNNVATKKKRPPVQDKSSASLAAARAAAYHHHNK